MPDPRIKLPASAGVGELVEVRTLISHDMENGQRKNSAGAIIPRKLIHRFTAAFNGTIVFEADWYTGIAANPYQSFFFRAVETGEFTVTWIDDDGSKYSAKALLTVA